MGIEQAWAAGFFDGEGSCNLNKTDRFHRGLQITIQQNDPEVLKRFHMAVGGAGRVCGPYQRKRPGTNPFWAYQCSEVKECQAVIRVLTPYLSSPKLRQINAMLSAYADYKEQLKAGTWVA